MSISPKKRTSNFLLLPKCPDQIYTLHTLFQKIVKGELNNITVSMFDAIWVLFSIKSEYILTVFLKKILVQASGWSPRPSNVNGSFTIDFTRAKISSQLEQTHIREILDPDLNSVAGIRIHSWQNENSTYMLQPHTCCSSAICLHAQSVWEAWKSLPGMTHTDVLWDEAMPGDNIS